MTLSSQDREMVSVLEGLKNVRIAVALKLESRIKYLHQIRETSRIGQGNESLIFTFEYFLTAITKV